MSSTCLDFPFLADTPKVIGFDRRYGLWLYARSSELGILIQYYASKLKYYSI